MTRIAVLGAGVSGLTSAVVLLEAEHRVQLVAAEPSLATTSALAAAVWFPTHVGPRERVLRWGRETFRVLAEQAAARVPGVVMRESLALYRRAPSDPEWASAVGGVRRAQADELPPGYQHGLRFAVPLAEMPRYLPWLVARVRSLGGELIWRRVSSLDELSEGVDVVVNCAGLGALELASDPTVYPVRGRIMRVTNPGLTMSVRDEEHPGGRAYVHPRAQDCILGGTLEKGEWDTAVDPVAGAAIVERCCDLAPALCGAQVLEQVVGLRPGRPTVRLEEGEAIGAGVRLVHNYGHGGAGITLMGAAPARSPRSSVPTSNPPRCSKRAGMADAQSSPAPGAVGCLNRRAAADAVLKLLPPPRLLRAKATAEELIAHGGGLFAGV